MSRTAVKPATTPIPVQLSKTEFTTGDEVDGIYNTFAKAGDEVGRLHPV